MNAIDIVTFLWGMFVGFILGAFVWSAVRYVVLTIKDRIKKRKAGNFTLAKNFKNGPPPKLIFFDDDDNANNN